MVRIKCTEDFKELRAVIKVIGLGGGGGNAINRMAEAKLPDVELIAANSDAQDLRRSKAHAKIQLGEEATRGLGVGGDPAKGRMAALESKEQLREVLAGADMVFITAGMGGGTGTGAAPIAAEVARESNALTVGVVTRPFHFEGQLRQTQAESGVKELREYVDTLLLIPNERLFEVLDERTALDEAYRKVDDVLLQAVQSISGVITAAGDINMDMNDIKAIMTGAGEALMGVGEADGPHRAVDAAKAAINSPLLENVTIDGAKGLIVNVVSSRKMPLADIKDAMEFINRAASPEVKTKYGQVYDETMGERLRVTVIATGFPSKRRGGFKPFGRLTRGAPLREFGAFGVPDGARAPAGGMGASSPEDWAKPAFLRWKVRKLR